MTVMQGSKQILEATRHAASARLASLQAEFDGIVEAVADANGDDEHDPEGATIAFERSRTASLIAETELALIDIDTALARLSDGSYGICAECTQTIGAKRLEAMPATRYCVRCASAASPGTGLG
jgi:RNA polymerase-binding transcription factor DksA